MLQGPRKYYLLLIACCVMAVTVELAAPNEVSWTPSYMRLHERPYGSRILYEQLPALFPEVPVETRREPPFVTLQSVPAPLNYLFVTSTFAPDAPTAEALLQFARRGNSVFVAAENFDGTLADSLELETTRDPSMAVRPADSNAFNFTNPPLHRPQPYVFRRGAGRTTFERFDTLRTTTLGTNGAQANFVRVSEGEGAFYLHTAPRAFTNYHMLDSDEAEYVARVLSHLPVRRTWWDAHYKPLRTASSNPLRYMLRQPSLRGAWYVFLLGVVLFMLFESKRRQRPIPTIEPPQNETLDFARTVGRLYLQHGNHADLAEKKIRHLNDFLHRRLRLSPEAEWDDQFVDRVASRSGASLETVGALADAIRTTSNREHLPAESLMHLSQCIEGFYQESRVNPVRNERSNLSSSNSIR